MLITGTYIKPHTSGEMIHSGTDFWGNGRRSMMETSSNMSG